MAVEAYIPSGPDSVTYDGDPLSQPVLITLYEPDGEKPNGSLTLDRPLPVGAEGSLVFEGTRDGKVWAVTVDRIIVRNSTAVGFEFSCAAPPRRVMVRDLDDQSGPHEKGFEEQFDIR